MNRVAGLSPPSKAWCRGAGSWFTSVIFPLSSVSQATSSPRCNGVCFFLVLVPNTLLLSSVTRHLGGSPCNLHLAGNPEERLPSPHHDFKRSLRTSLQQVAANTNRTVHWFAASASPSAGPGAVHGNRCRPCLKGQGQQGKPEHRTVTWLSCDSREELQEAQSHIQRPKSRLQVSGWTEGQSGKREPLEGGALTDPFTLARGDAGAEAWGLQCLAGERSGHAWVSAGSPCPGELGHQSSYQEPRLVRVDAVEGSLPLGQPAKPGQALAWESWLQPAPSVRLATPCAHSELLGHRHAVPHRVGGKGTSPLRSLASPEAPPAISCLGVGKRAARHMARGQPTALHLIHPVSFLPPPAFPWSRPV